MSLRHSIRDRRKYSEDPHALLQEVDPGDLIETPTELTDVARQLRNQERQAALESIAPPAIDPNPPVLPPLPAVPTAASFLVAKPVPPPLPPTPLRPQTLYPVARTCKRCHVPATGDYCANCYPRCGEDLETVERLQDDVCFASKTQATDDLPTLDGCPPFTAAMVEFASGDAA